MYRARCVLYNLKPVIPDPMDPLLLSIADVSRLLREGRITSLALTRLCLERTASLDAKLNAFITVTADSALAEAAEADRLIAEGRWLSPLHGIPVALKDLIDVAGVRTTAASRVLDNNIAKTDAPVVTRLRRAGAIILGKLNLHEFAYGGSGYISAYGPSLNPLDLSRTTGGSSSGCATAVAAHMCFAAIGSDTAGSIRLPAACCSLVGFKPTWGAVSVEGVIPLSASYDHVGPIARSVEDAALVLEAIVEPDFIDNTETRASTTRPILGVARKYFCDDMAPEVQVAFERSIEILESSFDIVEVEVPADTDRTLSSSEAFAYHRQYLEDRANRYDERTLARIMSGRDTTDDAVCDARNALVALRKHAQCHLASVDAVLTPTLPLVPPLLADLADPQKLRPLELKMLRNTRPFNVLGWPAITLPAMLLTDKLRLGLQFAARPGRDRHLLEVARIVESCIARMGEPGPSQ